MLVIRDMRHSSLPNNIASIAVLMHFWLCRGHQTNDSGECGVFLHSSR